MLAMLGRLLAGLSVLGLATTLLGAETAVSRLSDSPAAKYTLRYKFRAGESIKWQVEQKMKVDTTVSGNTQQAELATTSVKVWQIRDVAADGSTTLENLTEDVDWSQKLTGRAELRYNSKTDTKPPLGFETVAKSVGVPLSRITLGPQGNVLKREHLAGTESESQVTLPLPEQAIAVGESWSIPSEISVALPKGLAKRIKILQKFTLEEVRDGVATIRSVTQILTPIDNPLLETLVIQRETSGTIRFDLAAGRIVAQQTDADKKVFGFSGGASVYHYRNQFVEKLLTDNAPPAVKQAAEPLKAADRPGLSVEPPKTLREESKTAERLLTIPPEPRKQKKR